ncbi:MAG: hypothetical protein V4569_07210 [Pseudomonadota bacterium]
MKKIIAIVLAAGAIGSAAAQTSVGVSIGINQPGVYGRINIGDVPRPALILPQPVLIAPPRVAVQRAPIYLYVPPTHQQNWRQYCGRYEACGQPVYFVRDQWVRERYEHEHPGWNRGKHRGWDKHDKHGRHDDRGHGNGHGKGHGRD